MKNPKLHPDYGKLEGVEKNIQLVNVDITSLMLLELDSISEDLNIPRQSLIKTMLREAMDKYFSNKKMRKT